MTKISMTCSVYTLHFVFVVAMLYAIETLLWASIATTINGFTSSGVKRLGILVAIPLSTKTYQIFSFAFN